MDYPIGFAVSLLAIISGMTATGVPLLKALTLSIEGHKEFQGDSLTRREKTRGWLGSVIWAVVAVVIWSFMIDWFRAGNIEYARDALGYRIEHILEAMSQS